MGSQEAKVPVHRSRSGVPTRYGLKEPLLRPRSKDILGAEDIQPFREGRVFYVDCGNYGHAAKPVITEKTKKQFPPFIRAQSRPFLLRRASIATSASQKTRPEVLKRGKQFLADICKVRTQRARQEAVDFTSSTLSSPVCHEAGGWQSFSVHM